MRKKLADVLSQDEDSSRVLSAFEGCNGVHQKTYADPDRPPSTNKSVILSHESKVCTVHSHKANILAPFGPWMCRSFGDSIPGQSKVGVASAPLHPSFADMGRMHSTLVVSTW